MIIRTHDGNIINIDISKYVSDFEIYKEILFLKFGKRLDKQNNYLDNVINYIN